MYVNSMYHTTLNDNSATDLLLSLKYPFTLSPGLIGPTP